MFLFASSSFPSWWQLWRSSAHLHYMPRQTLGRQDKVIIELYMLLSMFFCTKETELLDISYHACSHNLTATYMPCCLYQFNAYRALSIKTCAYKRKLKSISLVKTLNFTNCSIYHIIILKKHSYILQINYISPSVEQ